MSVISGILLHYVTLCVISSFFTGPCRKHQFSLHQAFVTFLTWPFCSSIKKKSDSLHYVLHCCLSHLCLKMYEKSAIATVLKVKWKTVVLFRHHVLRPGCQRICYPVISAEKEKAPHLKAAVDKEKCWLSKDLKKTCSECDMKLWLLVAFKASRTGNLALLLFLLSLVYTKKNWIPFCKNYALYFIYSVYIDLFSFCYCDFQPWARRSPVFTNFTISSNNELNWNEKYAVNNKTVELLHVD